MTSSTFKVAVCCSSDSDNSAVRACTSSNSRTFSMAMTAWSAKVLTSSICVSVNGLTSERRIVITPMASSSRSKGTERIVRKPNRVAMSLPVGNDSSTDRS